MSGNTAQWLSYLKLIKQGSILELTNFKAARGYLDLHLDFYQESFGTQYPIKTSREIDKSFSFFHNYSTHY